MPYLTCSFIVIVNVIVRTCICQIEVIPDAAIGRRYQGHHNANIINAFTLDDDDSREESKRCSQRCENSRPNCGANNSARRRVSRHSHDENRSKVQRERATETMQGRVRQCLNPAHKRVSSREMFTCRAMAFLMISRSENCFAYCAHASMLLGSMCGREAGSIREDLHTDAGTQSLFRPRSNTLVASATSTSKARSHKERRSPTTRDGRRDDGVVGVVVLFACIGLLS